MEKNEFIMKEIINPKAIAESISAYFSPKIISQVNDQYVKVAKVKGDCIPWHTHDQEDELFYILEGKLCMEVKGQKPKNMQQGDLFVVSKGVEHRISSEQECLILLIESKTTKHTGDVKSPISKSIKDQL